MRNFVLFLSLLLPLAPGPALAAADEKITLSLERTSAIGLEQTSLQLEGKTVRYVTNTNYWQSRSLPTHHLGLLEAKNDKDLTAQIKKIGGTPGPWEKPRTEYFRSPHRTRALINGEEVPFGGALHNQIEDLISQTKPGETKWRVVDAISVNRNPQTGKLRMPASESKRLGLDCGSANNPQPTCRVENYGRLHQ